MATPATSGSAATRQRTREWLDELSAMDSLRFGATCREARETLGADGVAAAAFAVTRPWRANPCIIKNHP